MLVKARYNITMALVKVCDMHDLTEWWVEVEATHSFEIDVQRTRLTSAPTTTPRWSNCLRRTSATGGAAGVEAGSCHEAGGRAGPYLAVGRQGADGEVATRARLVGDVLNCSLVPSLA